MKRKIVKKAWSVSSRANWHCGEIAFGNTASQARNAYISTLDWDESFIEKVRYFSCVRRNKEHDLVENTPHPRSGEITKVQNKKMCHALGEPFHMDGPNERRNIYVSEPDSEWEDLIAKGFAFRKPAPSWSGRGNDVCYYVSELGKEVLSSLYPCRRFYLEHPSYATQT